MKNQIIPTVFAKNKKEFNTRFNMLIKINRNIQVDFMDGKFVSSKFMDFSAVPNLKKYDNNFEAHLMTLHPSNYIEKLRKKGFDKIIFHYGADDNVKTIAKIKKNGMKAFIAINPETKIREVCYLFDLVDGILVMGVNPGKENQKLIVGIDKKIKEIRKINKKINIQVDGGINDENIKKLAKSGANIFNTGSFVYESKNPGKALMDLKKRIQ